MSTKEKLCCGCGTYADPGKWVKDEDGVWWVCLKPKCSEGSIDVEN